MNKRFRKYSKIRDALSRITKVITPKFVISDPVTGRSILCNRTRSATFGTGVDISGRIWDELLFFLLDSGELVNADLLNSESRN